MLMRFIEMIKVIIKRNELLDENPSRVFDYNDLTSEEIAILMACS